MKLLNELLNTIYPEEDIQKALHLLKYKEFDEHIKSCIDEINIKLSNEVKDIEEFGIIQIGSITASFLIGINEHKRSLPKDGMFEEIEQVLADISKVLFEYILTHTKSDKSKLISLISNSLNEASNIFNYNQDAIFDFLQINNWKHQAYVLLNGERISPVLQKLRTFNWIGNPKKKMEFINLFSNKDLTLDNQDNKLINLFSNKPLNSLKINFNKDMARLLMTLFYLAKKNKLIKGPKEGFYTPLINHGIDFQEIILGKRTPSRYNDMLKKNKGEWLKNTESIEKWIIDMNKLK